MRDMWVWMCVARNILGHSRKNKHEANTLTQKVTTLYDSLQLQILMLYYNNDTVLYNITLHYILIAWIHILSRIMYLIAQSFAQKPSRFLFSSVKIEIPLLRACKSSSSLHIFACRFIWRTAPSVSGNSPIIIIFMIELTAATSKMLRRSLSSLIAVIDTNVKCGSLADLKRSLFKFASWNKQ